VCRLFAYLGPPATLEALLLAPPHSLLRQARAPRLQSHGRCNPDGFGAGWWDRDRRAEPARYRTARPLWEDRSFASLAGLVAAEAVVAAVRAATPGLPVEETGNAPFTAGPWLFAHNGAVDGFAEGGADGLRAGVSPARAAGIEGRTDSEVLFALVLDRLDAGAPPGEALAAVVAEVGGRWGGRLNLLLGDGERVAATARGNSLFVLEDEGLAAGGVVVASEPCDDGPGWRPVPDGWLVEASRQGVVMRAVGG
jgi:glutamine amidotransferase